MTLRAENISFAYPGGESVLHDITVELKPGVVTGVFGPNGSGKSTLLRCLNGSLHPATGRVMLDNQSLGKVAQNEIARHIAVVPQETPADIPLTVQQMVMLGRFPYWTPWAQESPEDWGIVQDSLNRMGIGRLKDRQFSQLSGGERQRVVIARALAQKGRLLLLDEPITHLDIGHQLEVYRLARTLAAEGQAVLMICHDLLLAPLFLDIAVLLNAGRMVAIGPTTVVLCANNLATSFNTSARILWEQGTTVSAVLGPPFGLFAVKP